MVGATRFEPATSSTPWKRATKLRHAPTRQREYLLRARPGLPPSNLQPHPSRNAKTIHQ